MYMSFSTVKISDTLLCFEMYVRKNQSQLNLTMFHDIAGSPPLRE